MRRQGSTGRPPPAHWYRPRRQSLRHIPQDQLEADRRLGIIAVTRDFAETASTVERDRSFHSGQRIEPQQLVAGGARVLNDSRH